MRYPAAEKLEIIRLVEQSHLPVRRTLEKLGIPRATFYLYVRLSHCKSILKWSAWPVANIYPASPG
jgi:transposase-like protein